MHEFYQLMQRAKQGDQEAISVIVRRFAPLIGRMKRDADWQDQDDLEQEIMEKIIDAILSYDMESIPTFSEFCNQILADTSAGRETLPRTGLLE